MNKSDLEKMQKAQEEYNKFFEDTPFQREIDKIARDIRERQDNAMAMEFTRTIAELLRKNGIVVHCTQTSYTKDLSDKSIENVYGVAFDSVDCAEHDKKFTDKIAKLEEENDRLRKSYDRHRRKICELESELSAKENLLKIKNGLCQEKPRIHIIGLREFGGEQYMRFSDVEDLIRELED